MLHLNLHRCHSCASHTACQNAQLQHQKAALGLPKAPKRSLSMHKTLKTRGWRHSCWAVAAVVHQVCLEQGTRKARALVLLLRGSLCAAAVPPLVRDDVVRPAGHKPLQEPQQVHLTNTSVEQNRRTKQASITQQSLQSRLLSMPVNQEALPAACCCGTWSRALRSYQCRAGCATLSQPGPAHLNCHVKVDVTELQAARRQSTGSELQMAWTARVSVSRKCQLYRCQQAAQHVQAFGNMQEAGQRTCRSLRDMITALAMMPQPTAANKGSTTGCTHLNPCLAAPGIARVFASSGKGTLRGLGPARYHVPMSITRHPHQHTKPLLLGLRALQALLLCLGCSKNSRLVPQREGPRSA